MNPALVLTVMAVHPSGAESAQSPTAFYVGATDILPRVGHDLRRGRAAARNHGRPETSAANDGFSPFDQRLGEFPLGAAMALRYGAEGR